MNEVLPGMVKIWQTAGKDRGTSVAALRRFRGVNASIKLPLTN
jgi:hypothetical protein